MTGFDVLERLKSDERTTRIPVIVHTSKALDPEERGRLAQKSVAIIGKGSKSRETAIAEVRESLGKAGLQVYEIQEAAES
jgi:CheY-like chemotaxis protein